MHPVTDAWGTAVRSGYTPTVRAQVWRDNAHVADLPVLGGGFTASESSKVRTNVTLALALDLDVDVLELLRLDDTDVRVWAGMERTDGSREEVPDMWGRVRAVSRPGLLDAVTVTVDDYAAVMQGARLLRPWATPAGHVVVEEIAALVHDVDPAIEVVDATGMYPRPRTRAATWDRERWDAIEALASGIGCEAVWSGERVLVVRPVPTATGTPVWELTAEAEDADLVDVGMDADDPGYNAVVATSSADTSAPVTAVAYAASWRAGVKRPRFYSSPLIATTTQARSAAYAILARSERWQMALTPEAVPNPALEVGDVVSAPVATDGLLVVTDISRPYGAAGAMRLGTRTSVDIESTLTVGDLS